VHAQSLATVKSQPEERAGEAVVCDLGRIQCEALAVARAARGHQVPATATTTARGVAGVIRRGPEATLVGLWAAGRTWRDMTITTHDSAHLRDEHVRKAGRAHQLDDAVRRRRSSVDELSPALHTGRCIPDKVTQKITKRYQ
jgi:hypothetical protein